MLCEIHWSEMVLGMPDFLCKKYCTTSVRLLYVRLLMTGGIAYRIKFTTLRRQPSSSVQLGQASQKCCSEVQILFQRGQSSYWWPTCKIHWTFSLCKCFSSQCCLWYLSEFFCEDTKGKLIVFNTFSVRVAANYEPIPYMQTYSLRS